MFRCEMLLEETHDFHALANPGLSIKSNLFYYWYHLDLNLHIISDVLSWPAIAGNESLTAGV